MHYKPLWLLCASGQFQGKSKLIVYIIPVDVARGACFSDAIFFKAYSLLKIEKIVPSPIDNPKNFDFACQ